MERRWREIEYRLYLVRATRGEGRVWLKKQELNRRRVSKRRFKRSIFSWGWGKALVIFVLTSPLLQVRDLLVPLLFNRTENYELRLAAFVLLMQFRPELYEIEGMARALKYDPDDQVRSFVYSTFKSIANSSHPCDRQL